MADCIECGEYTKYSGGLCSKCYLKKSLNKGSNDEFDDFFEDEVE